MNLTTVITNSSRSAMLMQAFQSVRTAGVPKIVIASAPVSPRVKEAHMMIRNLASATRIVALDPDPGCNATWLAGVKVAETEWVHILHDDDQVLPLFYSKLSAAYKPDIQFYLFDASAHNADGTIAPHHHKLWDKAGGVYPCLAFRPPLLRQTHSTSPISGVFRKEHLVRVLQEFQDNCAAKPEFRVREKMQAGNDLLIWLRATELTGNFLYVKEPLVSYGNHPNSTTLIDQKSGKPVLPTIYKTLKKYWSASFTRSQQEASVAEPKVVVATDALGKPELKPEATDAERKKIAMQETSKAMRRRRCEEAGGGFKWSEVFKGNGLDVGAGQDPIQLPNCRPFDRYDGDANNLTRHIPESSLDYLHASQSLEHMIDPRAALLNWSLCVKNGGYLIITVPDFDLYEKRQWPSRFNPDHKSAWSLWRRSHLKAPMVYVPEFCKEMESHGLRSIHARLIDNGFDYSAPDGTDQTLGEDAAEAFIELLFHKL